MTTSTAAPALRRGAGALVDVVASQALWLGCMVVAAALLSASYDCLRNLSLDGIVHGLVGLGVVLQLLRRLELLTGPARALDSTAWAKLGWKAARDALVVFWFLGHGGDREHMMVALASAQLSAEGIVYTGRALQQRRRESKDTRARLLADHRRSLLRLLGRRKAQLSSQHWNP